MKMEQSSVQKLAKVLRILIIALFVINILAVLSVAGVIHFSFDSLHGKWVGVEEGLRRFVDLWNYDIDDALGNLLWAPVLVLNFPHTAMLTVFLWACGICSAIMLWQAKRVLDTIQTGDTFTRGNAANMMRAAVCCFIISAAALVRLVWSMAYYKSSMPLVSYNTLFIPVFLVAGLVCIVMSALFRQAAEMKEENDLTI